MIAAAMVGLSPGCDDNAAGPGSPVLDAPSKGSFHVTWDPGAAIVTRQELGNLRRIDSADFRFHFDPAYQKGASLQPGQILVVGDYAIRKVKSVRTVGGELVVETESAPLTEAMVDADISWEHTVDVSAQTLSDGFGRYAGAKTTAYRDSVVVSFTWGAYGVEATVKGKGGKTAIEIKLLKERVSGSGAKTALYSLNGTLERFRSTGHIRIRDRELQEFTLDNDNVVADFTLTAIAAGVGNDLGIEIPIPLMKYIVPQLPFVSFNVKALGIINAVVPTDGSCDLGIRLQYVSNQGFQWDPLTKNIIPRSSVTWKGFAPKTNPKTAASSPIGVTFGIGFPRLEMEITGTNSNVWVQTAGLLGGDFTMFPVCRQARASAIFATGAAFSLKQGPALSFKKTLWQKDTTFFKTQSCP